MGSGQQRSGSFSVSIIELTHVVTFDTPLPSETYQVLIQPMSAVAISVWPSDLTSSGFTLNLSDGVNATFSYFAVAST